MADIHNQSDYSATTRGFGVELDDKIHIAPTLPMSESGHDSSETRSAIAAGTITITDEAAQKARTGQTIEEVLASLNRDTAGAHQGPLGDLPDLQHILDKQAEIVDAAGKAGPAVAKTVGDITEKMYALTGDENWKEGGIYKALLQAAGSALVAQIGNGSGLDAALGAMASQLAAGKVGKIASEIAGSMTTDPAKAALLAELIQNAASGAIGGAVGGETGSTSASNMDRYNRQLHKIEAVLIDAYAEKLLDSLDQAQKDQLCSQFDLCNLNKSQMIEIMTQAVLREIDNNWKETLPEADEFQTYVYKYLVEQANKDGMTLKGYKNEYGHDLTRELMADRTLAEELNKTRPNMTWEQVVEKYTNDGLTGDALYKEIIAASQRSNSQVNKSLGVDPSKIKK